MKDENSEMTPAQNKLYNILLNLFRNEGSTFPKNREELKKNYKFFEIILGKLPNPNKLYGLNTIIKRIVDLTKEKKRNDLFKIIRTSVLDTLNGDCSLKKIEYEELHDCLKSNKRTLYEKRYRTKEEVKIETKPEVDDIIKNAIKRLFINILIKSKSDNLFQSPGIYYLEVDDKTHFFPDEIDVKKFKEVIASFDNYIFQNQEIKNLIQTWGNELEKVLKNDIKTLENKQKTNSEIDKQSNGARGFFEDFLYNENDKEKETKKDVTTKKKDSKKVVTYSGIFKEVAKEKKKNTEKEKSNDSDKDDYFKDSKEEEAKDVKKKDNFDKVRDQTNEFEKKSDSKEKELIIDSNSKNNNNEKKNVVLDGYKPVTNHNNNCGCLTSFKECLKNCFG